MSNIIHLPTAAPEPVWQYRRLVHHAMVREAIQGTNLFERRIPRSSPDERERFNRITRQWDRFGLRGLHYERKQFLLNHGGGGS